MYVDGWRGGRVCGEANVKVGQMEGQHWLSARCEVHRCRRMEMEGWREGDRPTSTWAGLDVEILALGIALGWDRTGQDAARHDEAEVPTSCVRGWCGCVMVLVSGCMVTMAHTVYARQVTESELHNPFQSCLRTRRVVLCRYVDGGMQFSCGPAV